jgi:hypothetical protein
MKIETDDYCSFAEAATIYGCKKHRIYQLAKEGEIQFIELWGIKLAEKMSVIDAAQRIVPTKPRSGKPQGMENAPFLEKQLPHTNLTSQTGGDA